MKVLVPWIGAMYSVQWEWYQRIGGAYYLLLRRGIDVSDYMTYVIPREAVVLVLAATRDFCLTFNKTVLCTAKLIKFIQLSSALRKEAPCPFEVCQAAQRYFFFCTFKFIWPLYKVSGIKFSVLVRIQFGIF
jgi:hypothetical protein